jgi:hypothetical protein
MPSHRLPRDRWLDNDPHWERLMLRAVAAPRLSEPGHAARPQALQNVAQMRKADPVNYLLPASKAWLASLPAEVYPTTLAASYARIVNLLALHWQDHDACTVFLDNLHVDRRGNRQGFSAAVKSEIRVLQEHFRRTPAQGAGSPILGTWPRSDAYSI